MTSAIFQSLLGKIESDTKAEMKKKKSIRLLIWWIQFIKLTHLFSAFPTFPTAHAVYFFSLINGCRIADAISIIFSEHATPVCMGKTVKCNLSFYKL